MTQGRKQKRVMRDRSQEVLNAARTLFFKAGYRGTSIQQIASEAGYSKRTVYLDYPSKDELFIRICAEGGEELLARLLQIKADNLPVEESIARFLDEFIEFSRENGEYFRMIFSEATPEIIANCTADLRCRVANLESDCLRVIVSWIERAIDEELIGPEDPWETAGIFVGTATGIILMSMGGSQTVFEETVLPGLAHKAIMTLWKGYKTDHDRHVR